MNNYVQEGRVVTVPAPATVASGDPVKVRNMIGVASHDAESGADLDLAIEGVFTLPKQAVAITAGDKVYLHTTSLNITLTATSGDALGVAVSTQTAGDTTVKVRLNGAF